MKTVISIILGLSVMCAQDKPTWIDNPQSAYPNAQYISAVGSGDGRQSAENDAVSKLSRIFQSTITSEQTINERYKELFTSPNTSTYEQQTDVNKKSTIATSQTLYNFQIPETYTDNLGRTYAIAVIERIPTAEIYKKKIAENDKIMMDYVNRYLSVDDPVAKYASINAASVISAMNEGLKKQLLIIIPGETVKNALGYDDQKVGQMLTEARKDIPFTIEIKNDSLGKATAIVKEMLSEMGFVAAEKGVLTISGDISFEKIDLQRPEQFVRWSYNLSVIDRSGASIVSLSENGREGHVTYSEAVARATRTMKQRIKQNFAKEINRYFDSLVRK